MQRDQAITLNAQLGQIITLLQRQSPEQAESLQALRDPLIKKIATTAATPDQTSSAAAPQTSSRDPLLLVNDLGLPGKLRTLSKGPEVLILQKALCKLGFTLVPSGQFDHHTSAALRKYQIKHKLPPTGQLDARSRQSFNKTLHKMRLQTQREWAQASREGSANGSPSDNPDVEAILALPTPAAAEEAITALRSDLGPPTRQGFISAGAEVIFLQELLQTLERPVKPTGTYDNATAIAVRSFQSGQKLPVSGVVDARTRAALNARVQFMRLKNEALEAYAEKIADLAVLCRLEITALTEQILESMLRRLIALLFQSEQSVTSSQSCPEPEVKARLYLESDLSTRGQLHRVSEGPEVTLLSELMAHLAFDITPQVRFDLHMYSELKRLQEAYQLPPTGVCDAQTRQLLNHCLEQRYRIADAERELHLMTRDYLDRLEQALSEERLRQIQETLNLLLKRIKGEVSEAEADNPYFGLPARLKAELGPANRPGTVHEGPEVSLLQRLFMQQGYPVKESAHYDKETYSAVRAFQMRQKLPMTGLVDERTRDALNALLPPEEA